MVYLVLMFLWEHSHIIEAYHYTLPDELVKSNFHGVLKGCANIHKPKKHSFVCERTSLGTEGNLKFIKFCYQNLILS